MDERGFALPITLFLIAILTLMLGSSFSRVATENQIAGSSKSTVDALFVAQAGLERYFGQDFTSVNRPLSGDSVRLEMQGGYAWIVPEVLQTPADTMDNFRYIIRSTGYATDPNQGSTTLATHTVAQFADWQTPWLSAPPSALIAANGVRARRKSKGSILVTGDDLLPSCATIPAIAGVWVPADPMYLDVQEATVIPDPSTQSGTPLSVADLTGIEWNSVVSGAYKARYNSLQDGDNTYPSQLVDGDYAIGSTGSSLSGTGILIVTGDLDILGSDWTWKGIILVGGRMWISTDQGGQIEGAVITGLNHLLAGPPPDNLTQLEAPETGEMRLQFSSCYIQQALGSERGFIPIENTWIDNWATF